MSRIRSFMLLIPLVLSHSLAGQNSNPLASFNHPLRVEIPVRSDDETYQLIPCGERGVVLFFRSMETAGASNDVKWYFSLYDRNLRQEWIKSVPVPEGYSWVRSVTSGDTIFFFFRKPGKEKGEKYNFQFLRLVLASGNFITNFGKLPSEAEVAGFAIHSGHVYIGLNISDQPASLFILDFASGKSARFSLSESVTSVIRAFSFDTGDRKIKTILKLHYSKIQEEYYYSVFDTTGKNLGHSLLGTIQTDRDLKQIGMYRLSPTSEMILGTYGTISASRKKQKNADVEESSGLFSMVIENGLRKEVKFYNFLDLKNANTLLSERDLLDLKKKAMKKNRSAQEYSLGIQVLLHPVIPQMDQLILLAEAYLPQYHTENFTDYDFYGRPYTTSYTVFDGYRFTHGILAGFDLQGGLLWDNAIEIRNLKSFDLNPKLNLFFSGDEQVISYLSEGKIGSKVISGNATLEKQAFTPLQLMSDNDRLLSETKSRMIHWYDRYFLCFGFQEVKDLSRDGENKRQIYYFTKVRIE